MKTSHFFLCLATLFSAGPDLLARDIPDVNRQQMLSELEKLQKDRKEQWEVAIKKVIAEISSAAASPQAAARLYQEAMKAVHAGESDESGNRKGGRRQDDVQGSSTFRTGMQFRLRFLCMLLRLASGEDTEAMFPEVERYVNELLADKKLVEDKQAKNIWGAAINAKDPIVQMFRIEPYLKSGKGFGMSPGDAEALLDGVLMPRYREKKDPKLIQCWDDRIERERDQVEEAGLDMGKDRFETETLPRLRWQRAKDCAAIDEPNRAISEMFALIRQNPGHPDFDGWVDQLKALLQQ